MKIQKNLPKIIAPIDKFDEINFLHQAGADEFYGGYVPSFWSKKYPVWISPNGRTFFDAQIKTKNVLKEILNYCENNKIKFSLTLNAPLYLPDHYPLLFKIIEEYISLGGEDIIVSDLGLIFSLNEKKYPIKVHLGVNSAVLNHFSALFYKDFGVERIILSRELSIGEISKIVKEVPEIKFDVFMLIGKCPNIEGLCTFLHDSPDRVWHCVENYIIKAEGRRQKAEGGIIKNIWAGIKRTDACGLCQIKKLIDLKVHGFKIVGRGAGKERKIKSISGLKKMIEIASGCENEKEIFIEAHKMYKDIFGHSCSEELCYFPFERSQG